MFMTWKNSNDIIQQGIEIWIPTPDCTVQIDMGQRICTNLPFVLFICSEYPGAL
jgi:hypothetical protein